MTILHALILGIIQGATEFLPISSSGHLALLPWWFGWEIPNNIVFVVAVHLGTLVAVVLYFWEDWLGIARGAWELVSHRRVNSAESRLFLAIVIGSLPIALVGAFLSQVLDQVFETPAVVALFLLVTAALLTFSERKSVGDAGHFRHLENIRWQDALFVGLAQLIALLPGISRSGSTIAAGLFRGIDRTDSARFSFLLGTPAILGAGLVTVLHANEAMPAAIDPLPILVGFGSAAVVGYLAIALLLNVVRRHRLYGFAAYCVIFATLSLGAVIIGR
ncbi:MAG: undecaprenyl-diphosphatase UppP [Anaerolineae bacterium]